MSLKIVFRGILAATAIVTAAYGLGSPHAGAAFPFKGACLNQTGCGLCCPVCDHVCKLDAEQVDEDIPCFEVESKVICIPRVVFPWQKKKCSACDSCDGRGCNNCVHNGARVRRICVLKTDKITCPKCKYSWSAEKRSAGCDVGCDGCCDGGCDSTIVTSGNWHASSHVPQPVPQAPAEVQVQSVQIGQPAVSSAQ